MSQIKINGTIKEWNLVTARGEADKMIFKLEDGRVLELSGLHEQDCCEDVAFDFDEVPKEVLDPIVGCFVTNLILTMQEEGGALLRFETNIPDPIFEDVTVSYPVLIGCHDFQNGYYSNELALVISIDEKIIAESVNSFTAQDHNL